MLSAQEQRAYMKGTACYAWHGMHRERDRAGEEAAHICYIHIQRAACTWRFEYYLLLPPDTYSMPCYYCLRMPKYREVLLFWHVFFSVIKSKEMFTAFLLYKARHIGAAKSLWSLSLSHRLEYYLRLICLLYGITYVLTGMPRLSQREIYSLLVSCHGHAHSADIACLLHAAAQSHIELSSPDRKYPTSYRHAMFCR